MTLDCEIVLTQSGDKAVLDRISGEVMHPRIGPLTEARALYVEPSRLAARLMAPGEQPVVVLDVGLGAGSNAIAAWNLTRSLETRRRALQIVSFDRTTAALELALDPAHAEAFGFDPPARAAASELLRSGQTGGANLGWRLQVGELPDSLLLLRDLAADVVFWDPFSRRRTPELWTLRAFQAARARCRAGATLHTYSAATSVRSALLLAGFAVGYGPAITGGKPSTLAAVDVNDLSEPLTRRFVDRLTRSGAPFPDDAPSDALARIAALPQFC